MYKFLPVLGTFIIGVIGLGLALMVMGLIHTINVHYPDFFLYSFTAISGFIGIMAIGALIIDLIGSW